MTTPQSPLSVLMYARADARDNPGGDVVEAECLCKALNDAGHRAKLSIGPEAPGPWDIVHLFNIDRAPELAEWLDRHAGFADTRVVLAPVVACGPQTPSPAARALRAAANLIRRLQRPSLNWIPGHGLKALIRLSLIHI